MTSNKGKFTKKAEKILNSSHVSSISDFLGGGESKPVQTKPVKTEKKTKEKENIKTSVNPKKIEEENNENKERMEVRITLELKKRLLKYQFENQINTGKKKSNVDIVEEALVYFLNKQGF